jgi:hypothetical protein
MASMDSPTTTKADRLYALNLTGHTHELYVEWAENGKSRMASEYPTSSFADVIARMEIMAAAHAAGYARATADIRAELDRAARNAEARAERESGAMRQALVAMGSVLRSSIERIDDGSCVGASEKERGG